MDGENNVQLQRLKFDPSDTSLKLTIMERQVAPPMSLVDFLDCNMDSINIRQFKGAFIYQYPGTTKFRSFIFVENYYMISTYDLIQIQFKMGMAELGDLKRVEYANPDEHPLADRISFKYVKIMDNNLYFTPSYQESYELQFAGDIEEERLVAKRSVWYDLSFCPGSTLTRRFLV